MSSAPASDEYSYAHSADYNLQFTADISKQMQMPDRLAAADGFRKMRFRGDLAADSFMSESPAFTMTMPDKIILGAADSRSDHSLQAADHLINGHVDDEEQQPEAEYEPMNHVANTDLQATPQRRRVDGNLFAAGDMVVPATPSSMLKSSTYGRQSRPDVDWSSLQRHVAKLTCRVERLEEENGRRRQRDILLYPLLFGCCLLQIARILLSRHK